MISGIELQQETKTNYYRLYKNERGFAAEIIMNPRDAMVFASIVSLPEASHEAVDSVDLFLFILDKDYGAKSSLHISPDLLKKLKIETLSTKGVGRYLSIEEAKKAVAKIRSKKHVADQLAKFLTGEYTLLTKEDLKLRAAELSEFKIKYSSFASVEKIINGQYSERAEEDKLNNPYVEHYAIEHEGKIIACVMHVIHGSDTTYDADFVVHPDYRSKNIHPQQLKEEEKNYPRGLSQALCVKAIDHMIEVYPQLKHSWLIAGGYGALGVGAHLYDEIFPTKELQNNPALQNEVCLFLRFGNPGVQLLLAANRDPVTQRVNQDEDVYTTAALDIAAQSTEPNLAAKQPDVKKEIGIPGSMFRNTTNIPTTTPEEEKVAENQLSQ